jgi:hypothetical protein
MFGEYSSFYFNMHGTGALNCFEELNFNKLELKCCNSLIGLCLGANKTIVSNEIVQISALNCF